MQGHGLVYEGAPHSATGTRMPNPGGVGGIGRGKCACGALSEVLPSAAARKRWHKTHKAEIAETEQRTA